MAKHCGATLVHDWKCKKWPSTLHSHATCRCGNSLRYVRCACEQSFGFIRAHVHVHEK